MNTKYTSAKQSPRVGDTGIYHSPTTGDESFEILSINGNLCYARYEHDKSNPCSFIWKFERDNTLNNLHDWPSKTKGI
jgi:hypothetical protein